MRQAIPLTLPNFHRSRGAGPGHFGTSGADYAYPWNRELRSEAEDQTGSVFRTQDETQNVLAVGDALATALEQRGYGVIHDKTLCDYPEYTGAYNRSREVIEDNLQQYPSIAVVLDIHRDAVENSDGTQMRMACTVDGGTMSQLMLVVGHR